MRIEIGIQITRRKFVHQVVNDAGEVIYIDRSIGKVLRWCFENDVLDFEIMEADRRWQVSLSPLPR